MGSELAYIHLFIPQIFIAYLLPGLIMGARDKAASKTETKQNKIYLHRAYILERIKESNDKNLGLAGS